jgi:hypothetical protein
VMLCIPIPLTPQGGDALRAPSRRARVALPSPDIAVRHESKLQLLGFGNEHGNRARDCTESTMASTNAYGECLCDSRIEAGRGMTVASRHKKEGPPAAPLFEQI